jgi:phytoene dehydrogenase-like protein
MSKPVVVVGAGIAGLVCARKLYQSGIPVLVVDADDRPGGRLKTDRVGGFLLDRGFQVMFTAYPTARRTLDLDALKLGRFESGASIYHNGSLHLLEPQSLMEMIRTRFEIVRDKTIPLADKRLLQKLSSSVGQMSPRQAYASDPVPTDEYLREFGFGDEIMDRFFRPFLGGIFLDKSLAVDSRQFLFIWGMLNQGQTTIPAEGIEAIPNQVAADIPRYLFRFGSRVVEILRDSHGHPTGVKFDTTEVMEASAVVVATEAPEARRLVGQDLETEFKSSTCLYFETPTPMVNGAYLVLNGSGSGLVNHVAPLSNAAPGYAPAGKHLASVTVLGNPAQTDEELAEAVKQELNEWVPDKGAYMWRFIRAYRVANAQMSQQVGFAEHTPGNATSRSGLYWAGEFTQNSSIDGAIRSGLDAAALVLSEREAAEAA